MRRLPAGMLVAATAALWCAQASAQHHMKSTPPPTPPGTTLNNTPGPTNRGPGGGGPFGTATVDPRCATSVVCGPGQTAAPGGPSLNNQNLGPTSERPRLGGPATAVQANRARLQSALEAEEKKREALFADPYFISVVGTDPAFIEYSELLRGKDGGAEARQSHKDAINKLQETIAQQRRARDATNDAGEFARLGGLIEAQTNMLLEIRELDRAATRQRDARLAELEALTTRISDFNHQRWNEEVTSSAVRVNTLRIRLGRGPEGNNLQQVIQMMTGN